MNTYPHDDSREPLAGWGNDGINPAAKCFPIYVGGPRCVNAPLVARAVFGLACSILLAGCALGYKDEGEIDYRKAEILESERHSLQYCHPPDECSYIENVQGEVIRVAPLMKKNVEQKGSVTTTFGTGEKISVRLVSAFIENYTEGPWSWVGDAVQGQVISRGEIAIAVKVSPILPGGKAGSRSVGFDFSAQAAHQARVVFYSDDVVAGQFLNFSNMPIYGPSSEGTDGITVEIWIMELDTSDAITGQLLTTLAGFGQIPIPTQFPGRKILNALGSTLLDSQETHDTNFLYRMLLEPSDDASQLLHSSLEVGHYVFIRSERGSTEEIQNIGGIVGVDAGHARKGERSSVNWSTLVLDENTGRLYKKLKKEAKDTGCAGSGVDENRSDKAKKCYTYEEYREANYLVISIDKDTSETDLAVTNVLYGELSDTLRDNAVLSYSGDLLPLVVIQRMQPAMRYMGALVRDKQQQEKRPEQERKAQRALGDAQTALGDAQTALTEKAPRAPEDAETAKKALEDAKTAKKALKDAEMAQRAAKTAQKTAKTAQKATKTAQKATKTAQKATKTAQKTAETAEEIAETAEEVAKTAQKAAKTAEEAETTLGEATAAEEAKTDGSVTPTPSLLGEATAAEEAKTAAEEATRAAREAKTAAEEATRAAREAKTAAATKQEITETQMKIQDATKKVLRATKKVLKETKEKALETKEKALETKEKALETTEKALETTEKVLETTEKALKTTEKTPKETTKKVEEATKKVEEATKKVEGVKDMEKEQKALERRVLRGQALFRGEFSHFWDVNIAPSLFRKPEYFQESGKIPLTNVQLGRVSTELAGNMANAGVDVSECGHLFSWVQRGLSSEQDADDWKESIISYVAGKNACPAERMKKSDRDSTRP